MGSNNEVNHFEENREGITHVSFEGNLKCDRPDDVNGAHLIEIEEDDDSRDSNIFLDNLPDEIVSYILTNFLDGKSLSTALIGFLGHSAKRDLIWRYFQSSLSARTHKLCRSNYLPKLHNDIWKELPHYTDIMKHMTDNSQLCARVRRFSQICVILTFFEPFITPRQQQGRYIENEKENHGGIEFPIWSGTLKSRSHHFASTTSDSRDYRNRSQTSQQHTTTVEEASIVMSMPHTSWCNLYLSTWREFNALPCIEPAVRRATPLPPVLRIRGNNHNDQQSLRRFASILEARDEVGCIRHGITSLCQPGGYLSSIIFMSRKQAIRRWESQSYISQPFQSTWPLTIESVDGEDELFGFLVTRDYNKEREHVSIEMLAESILAYMLDHEARCSEILGHAS